MNSLPPMRRVLLLGLLLSCAQLSRAATQADLDGDGRADTVALVNAASFRGMHRYELLVAYKGTGNESVLTLRTARDVAYAETSDVDGDADHDLVLWDAFHRVIAVFLNDANGGFTLAPDPGAFALETPWSQPSLVDARCGVGHLWRAGGGRVCVEQPRDAVWIARFDAALAATGAVPAGGWLPRRRSRAPPSLL